MPHEALTYGAKKTSSKRVSQNSHLGFSIAQLTISMI